LAGRITGESRDRNPPYYPPHHQSTPEDCTFESARVFFCRHISLCLTGFHELKRLSASKGVRSHKSLIGYYLLENSNHSTKHSMNSIHFDQGNADTQSQGLQQQPYGPYEPSIASSVSSSQYSVFSDSASAQSSIASSISDDFRGSQEDPRDRYCAIAQLQSQAQDVSQISQPCRQHFSYADVTSVPSEQRQHPRRCSLARNQRPPPLVRQAERKLTFVDNLVGKQIT